MDAMVVSRAAVENYLMNLEYPKFQYVATDFYPDPDLINTTTQSNIYASPEMEIRVAQKAYGSNVKGVSLTGERRLYPALMKDISALDDYAVNEPERMWFVVGKNSSIKKLINLPTQGGSYNGSEKVGLRSAIWLKGPIEGGFFNKFQKEITDMATYQNRFPEVVRKGFYPDPVA